MKKWAILAIGIFFLALPDVKADSWNSGDFITGMYKYQVENRHDFTLEEDARVTFTLKEGVSFHRGYSEPNKYNVVVFDNKDERIASISTLLDDGDQEKTVHSVNLKKGVYHIQIYGEMSAIGDYAVKYETDSVVGLDVEPNNEQSTANSYTVGQKVRGELYDRGFISDDYDIYKVELPTFGKLKAHIQVTDGTLKNSILIMMEAFNKKNERMFQFKNAGNPDAMEILLQPGTYFLKIKRSISSQEVVDYTFSTSFEPLPEEDWESGRNLTKSSADLLKNNKTYRAFVYESNWGYDQWDDYYKFQLAKDAKVTFIANAQNSLGQLFFFNEEGTQLATGGVIPGDTRRIVTTKQLKAGTYYVSYRTRYGAPVGYEGYDLTIQIQSFKDVPATHLYYDSIEKITQLGINKGYPDGTFHPNETIKRMHVFALLNRVDGLKLTKIRTMKGFKDLSNQHPNYPEMKVFYEAGIIDGSGSYMYPESTLIRGQLAKILVNTFQLKMKGKGISFTDVKPSNHYYQHIQILASNGITIGSNGKFLPNEPVTRQHFSIFLQRILDTK